MAKKVKHINSNPSPEPTKATIDHVGLRPAEKGKTNFLDFRLQAVILAIIVLIFYANTFTHEAAFDDRMAITDNEYVQAGAAGIPDILTRDAYQSYLEHRQSSNQLSGGRYRPLSLITFAIEQQVMGIAHDNETSNEKEARIAHEMPARHVVNVLLYILTVIPLLYFFRTIIFPDQPIIAFLAALIFTIHPIHTEVVANVKSRDEILSVLFIALTFIKAFRYYDTRNIKELVWASVSFFLALLSKEYAVTLVLLIPLSFFLFRNGKLSKSFKAFLPYLIPLGLYFVLRFASVTPATEGAETNVMNNPYFLASGVQKIASQFLVLLNYLKLLVYPNPLAADYSYNQLPYSDFANPLVWLSLAAYLVLTGVMCRLFLKRHVLGFAIAVYLFPLFLVSNLLFNIGAPMGERLVFLSSTGFSIALAWLMGQAAELIKSRILANASLIGLMTLFIVLSGFKTIDRNKAWKNDETLFLTDVKTVPNSVLVNNNAAAACMSEAKENKDDIPVRNEWFTKAIGYFDQAISIYPKHTLAHLNRGLCYFNMGNADMALDDWLAVKQQEPNQENISKYLSIAGKYFFNQGMKYKNTGKNDSAITAFHKSIEAMPSVVAPFLELSRAYSSETKFNEAKEAVDSALKMEPNNTDAINLKKAIIFDEISVQSTIQWNYVEPAVSKKPNKR